jgi:hypothetical protein
LFICKILNTACTFLRPGTVTCVSHDIPFPSLLQLSFRKTDLPTHFQKSRTLNISTATSGRTPTPHTVYIIISVLIYFGTSRDKYVYLYNTPRQITAYVYNNKILTTNLNICMYSGPWSCMTLCCITGLPKSRYTA